MDPSIKTDITAPPSTYQRKKLSGLERLKKLVVKRVHIIEWMPRYTREDVISDIIAGITVGMTMIPQSIAYANLAGIQAQYGLYTAFIGSFTYIFFGTIKQVSIGPSSLMSILTKNYTYGLDIRYVILLTFLAGIVELLMGILKLGFLIDFISPVVTSGFKSASAIIIIIAQAKELLGIKIKSHDFLDLIKQLVQRLGEAKLADSLLSLFCFVFLILMKNITKLPAKNPKTKKLLWYLSISKNALLVFITSLFAFCLEEYAGGAPFALSDKVPKGLPSIGFPTFSEGENNIFDMIRTLGTGIVVVPVIAILVNVAIAKTYSADVIVDASQEMMTLGLCNIFGSCIQAMPSCGAFTRSAVADSSGVVTPLQGIYSGSVIILALSFLTPYFNYIPKATLGSVLVFAVTTLLDFEIYPKLWKTKKFECFLTAATFIQGIFLGVELSVITGCLISFILLLKPWARPNILKEIRTMEKYNDYIYLKPELGLLFPGVDYLTETIKKEHNYNPCLPIALDCSNFIRIDYSGIKGLLGLLTNYNKKQVTLVLIKLKHEILKELEEVIEIDQLYLCDTEEDLPDKFFNYTKSLSKEEVPLMITSLEDNLKSKNNENNDDVNA